MKQYQYLYGIYTNDAFVLKYRAEIPNRYLSDG